jgi:hypothetical protein
MKAGFLTTMAALALASCNQGPPPVPIKDLVANEVQPTAQIYWDAVRYESVLVDGKPVDRDIRPETDADWEKARKAAEDLGKFGELLQTEAYTEGRNADWTQFAKGLVDVAKLAEQAAVEKDVDKVFEVGGTVYSVCSACHQIYPPAAGLGETSPAS